MQCKLLVVSCTQVSCSELILIYNSNSDVNGRNNYSFFHLLIMSSLFLRWDFCKQSLFKGNSFTVTLLKHWKSVHNKQQVSYRRYRSVNPRYAQLARHIKKEWIFSLFSRLPSMRVWIVNWTRTQTKRHAAPVSERLSLRVVTRHTLIGWSVFVNTFACVPSESIDRPSFVRRQFYYLLSLLVCISQ